MQGHRRWPRRGALRWGREGQRPDREGGPGLEWSGHKDEEVLGSVYPEREEGGPRSNLERAGGRPSPSPPTAVLRGSPMCKRFSST